MYPEPEACLIGPARVQRHDDIIPFVDILANLMYAGVINAHFAIRSPVFNGPLDAEKTALDTKPDGGSAEEWNSYAASKNLHFWQTDLHFYGPAKVAAAQWEHVKERLSAISGASFEDGPIYRFPLTDAEIENLAEKGALGIPSLAVFGGLLLRKRTLRSPATWIFLQSYRPPAKPSSRRAAFSTAPSGRWASCRKTATRRRSIGARSSCSTACPSLVIPR